jgi:3-oxoacyl-[acyl-carrier-protein] synthase II
MWQSPLEVVAAGVGVLSLIGIGCDAFWVALCRDQSCVGTNESFDASSMPGQIAAEVHQFNPKQYIANRKLKVMCRDAEVGVAMAGLACHDAGIEIGQVDLERLATHL